MISTIRAGVDVVTIVIDAIRAAMAIESDVTEEASVIVIDVSIRLRGLQSRCFDYPLFRSN